MINRKIILSVFITLAVFFTICLIYAHYEYKQLKVKAIEIALKDIPEEFDGHKIYTTSGVGGGAFEMFIRFFAQPEIVVLKLRKVK
jgi:putative phosphoesterase